MERSSASNVEILLPLPPDIITPTVQALQVCHTVLERCISVYLSHDSHSVSRDRCLQFVLRMSISNCHACLALSRACALYDTVCFKSSEPCIAHCTK